MTSRFQIAVLFLLVTGCGSNTGSPGHNGGSSSAGQGAGGSAGSNPVAGGATGASGSSGAVGGNASGGAAGSEGGATLTIPPYATHIACNSTENLAVLTDNSLYSWGAGSGAYERASQYAQVAASGKDACFILQDGTIYCADNGTPVAKNAPKGTFSEIRVGSAEVGYAAACAKDAARMLTCWGDAGNPVVSQAPTAAVSQFDVSSPRACAVLQGGAAQCWGSSATAPTTHTDFTSIYSNAPFSCGISAASAMDCWTLGQQPSAGIAQLSIGVNFACAIKTSGQVVCFDQQVTDTSVPQPPATATFVEVSVCDKRACGVHADGTVTCWGSQANDPLQAAPPDAIRVL